MAILITFIVGLMLAEEDECVHDPEWSTFVVAEQIRRKERFDARMTERHDQATERT